MKISELLARGKPTLSFEVFPPKTLDTYERVESAALKIAQLSPSFMSVTYGAGGGTSDYTVRIARTLGAAGVTPLAHLTCVSSTREKVRGVLSQLRAAGVENVLALRGDVPPDGRAATDYRYAAELIAEIKSEGGFCIGAACYPEGHIESRNRADDLAHLCEKVEAGCDFLTTQMFFDNAVVYHFLYRLRERGVTVPVVAGIMPVTSAAQIARITSLSGTYLPARFKAIVDRFGDHPAAMKQAGVAYACEQIIDLIANGINAIHVYSMNKPDVAAAIAQNLGAVLHA